MGRNKGYRVSDETKNKISEKAKLRVGCKHNRYGKFHSTETKNKMSACQKGKKTNRKADWLKNNPPRKGVRLSDETKQKMRVAANLSVKEGRHNMWKGGVSSINDRIRNSSKYKQWRKSVIERDNKTCIKCGRSDDKIEVDHIYPFSIYPELRFDINNGRTLCCRCHRKTKTYGSGNIRKYVMELPLL